MKKEFVKVKNDQLTIKQNWKSIKSRITGAYEIVSDLAKFAKM